MSIINDYLDKLQEGCDFQLNREQLAFAKALLISYGAEVLGSKQCRDECLRLYDEELKSVLT